MSTWGDVHRRNFVRSNSGSVAVLAAFMLLIVAGAIGMCLDGGRAYTVRIQLQTAVDAAVLASARRLSDDPSADAQTVFESFFTASFAGKHSAQIRSVNVTTSDTMVEGSVTADVPTTFMQLFSFDHLEMVTSAQARFGMEEIEVVLALDNTGSMAGTKLDALKSASHALIDSLTTANPAAEKLRLGVVPFARYVNVGLGNRNASWLDVPLDYTETVSGCQDTYPNAVASNCRNVTSTCYNDGTPYSCTYQVCDWNYGTPVNVCSTWTNSYTWSGCVRSRTYPLNLRDGSYSTRIPGVLNASCPSAITPLTSNHSSVRAAIDAMTASDETYIPEGLMWAWRALSPTAPFEESKAGAVGRLARYVVLMTDGANTASPQADNHNGTDAALANQYTAEACDAIKADGIKIFTIAFEVSNSAIKDILRTCATNPGSFFDATDAAALRASFDSIGTQISSLRLTN